MDFNAERDLKNEIIRNLKVTVSFSSDETEKAVRPLKGQSLIKNVSDYVVVDLETTGLSPAYDSIIEAAAVRVESGKIAGRFQSLIKLCGALPSFITHLTGITDEMLSTAPELPDVFPRFIEFIGNSVVVAHNANFDINFVYDTCLQILKTEFTNDFIDTMRMSRCLFREYRHHRLSDLAERFGIEGGVEHRALSDAIKTFKCYEYMKKYAADSGIEFFSSFYPAKSNLRAKDITTSKTDFDTSSPIYGKVFVFTGALDKLPRKEAMRLVVNMGGVCADGVTSKTNFLPVRYNRNKSKNPVKSRVGGYGVILFQHYAK